MQVANNSSQSKRTGTLKKSNAHQVKRVVSRKPSATNVASSGAAGTSDVLHKYLRPEATSSNIQKSNSIINSALAVAPSKTKITQQQPMTTSAQLLRRPGGSSQIKTAESTGRRSPTKRQQSALHQHKAPNVKDFSVLYGRSVLDSRKSTSNITNRKPSTMTKVMAT